MSFWSGNESHNDVGKKADHANPATLAPTAKEPEIVSAAPSFLAMLSPDQVLKAAINAKPRSALAAQLGEPKGLEAPAAKREYPRKLGTRSSNHSPATGSADVAAASQPGLSLPTGLSVCEDGNPAGARKKSSELTPEGLHADSAPFSTSTSDMEASCAEGLTSAAAASTMPAEFDGLAGTEDSFGRRDMASPVVKDPPSNKKTSSKKLAPSSLDAAAILGELWKK